MTSGLDATNFYCSYLCPS
ncbi:hypothetical protein [Pseudarthrobacter sp. W1I19]